jgi:hypothetical protein
VIANKFKPARPALTIISALEDPALFKPWFAGDCWRTWKVVLKAGSGLALDASERALFSGVADRDPPTQPVRERWYICGRRAGKDSVATTTAAFEAAFFNKQHLLRPGVSPLRLRLRRTGDFA